MVSRQSGQREILCAFGDSSDAALIAKAANASKSDRARYSFVLDESAERNLLKIAGPPEPHRPRATASDRWQYCRRHWSVRKEKRRPAWGTGGAVLLTAIAASGGDKKRSGNGSPGQKLPRIRDRLVSLVRNRKPKRPPDIPLAGVWRGVWDGAGRRVSVRFLPSTLWGVSVQIKRDTLVAVCQLAGIGAAALILPCSLIDLAFDTDFLNMLMQAALVGVALALMVAVWTDQEE